MCTISDEVGLIVLAAIAVWSVAAYCGLWWVAGHPWGDRHRQRLRPRRAAGGLRPSGAGALSVRGT